MKLIGYPKVPYPLFSFVKKIDDIIKTPNNSIVAFEFNIDLALYCQTQKVPFAPIVLSKLEAVISENLNASYLICDKNLAFCLQELADYYLFDAKILALISSEVEIDECLERKIDGVIFKEVLYGKD